MSKYKALRKGQKYRSNQTDSIPETAISVISDLKEQIA